jgi:hypothetical protein
MAVACGNGRMHARDMPITAADNPSLPSGIRARNADVRRMMAPFDHASDFRVERLLAGA